MISCRQQMAAGGDAWQHYRSRQRASYRGNRQRAGLYPLYPPPASPAGRLLLQRLRKSQSTTVLYGEPEGALEQLALQDGGSSLFPQLDGGGSSVRADPAAGALAGFTWLSMLRLRAEADVVCIAAAGRVQACQTPRQSVAAPRCPLALAAVAAKPFGHSCRCFLASIRLAVACVRSAYPSSNPRRTLVCLRPLSSGSFPFPGTSCRAFHPPLHLFPSHPQRLIVVANRLPVSAYKDRSGRWQLQVRVHGCGGRWAVGQDAMQ